MRLAFAASRIFLSLSLLALNIIGGETSAAAPQVEHIVVKFIEPKMEPRSFAAQPKEYWRMGIEHGRIQEALDVPRHLHTLQISNPPEYYDINLETQKGTHVTLDKKVPVHLPIFTGHNPSALKLRDLEYGQEVAYFEKQKINPTAKTDATGSYLQYQLPVADVIVFLDVDTKTKKPLRISLRSQNAKGKMTLQYTAYESLPYDAQLFAVPKGVSVTNMTMEEFRRQKEEMEAKIIEFKKHAQPASKPAAGK